MPGSLKRKTRPDDQRSRRMQEMNQNPEHQAVAAKAAGVALASLLRGSGKGNRYIKEDCQHQHRTVAERVLRRKLLAEEVVHHEDRDKRNNDPSNLFVFANQADHARHHGHGFKPCPCSFIRLEDRTK